MKSARTLYVAISSHGYGHVAQTAPVLNELHRRIPDLKLVVESAVPRAHLESRIAAPFEHLPVATDFGMVMHDALTVDVTASEARYLEFHRGLDVAIQDARDRMRVHAPDLVFSNIPYVPIRAAHELGVPCVAMSSLNWADILAPVVAPSPDMRCVVDDMRAAYRLASSFLVLEPGMPMSWLANARPIGPVAAVGGMRRDELRSQVPVHDATRVVLVSMGGIATELDVANWPSIPAIHWIIAGQAGIERPDVTALDKIAMPYLDVLASCDAMVTKLGYGAFVEAACAGVSVAYISREQWPETPCLTGWLESHARAAEIGKSALFDHRLGEALERLWRLPACSPVVPTGIHEAVSVLEALLQ